MVKMKCGGSVSKAMEQVKKCGGGRMKEGGDVDLKQDKALIKKAIAQHDKQEHPGEKTELKLKKGGRSKKAQGSVKKYKAGGAIEMKKTAGDKDTIKKVKATGDKKADAPNAATKRPNLKGSDVEKEKGKPAGEKDLIKKVKPTGDKKADAPNKAAVKPNMSGIDAVDDLKGGGRPKYKKGGGVKKFADGGLTGDNLQQAQDNLKNAQDAQNNYSSWMSNLANTRPANYTRQLQGAGQQLNQLGDAALAAHHNLEAVRQANQAAGQAAALQRNKWARPAPTGGYGMAPRPMANGGTTGAGGIGTQGPIPPSIAAQLMMAAKGANLQGANPSPMGSNPLPVDNPVVGGGTANAYQRFLQENPGAKGQGVISERERAMLLNSPAFRQSNRKFTDR